MRQKWYFWSSRNLKPGESSRERFTLRSIISSGYQYLATKIQPPFSHQPWQIAQAVHGVTNSDPSTGWQAPCESLLGSTPPPAWSDVSGGDGLCPCSIAPVPALQLLACVWCWQLINNVVPGIWLRRTHVQRQNTRHSSHHPREALHSTFTPVFILASGLIIWVTSSVLIPTGQYRENHLSVAFYLSNEKAKKS